MHLVAMPLGASLRDFAWPVLALAMWNNELPLAETTSILNGYEGGDPNNDTSVICIKLCLKKSIFCALFFFLLIKFFLCYCYFFFALDCVCFCKAAGCIVVGGSHEDAEGTHTQRDDSIVFMDQGSCISFSKGTFSPYLFCIKHIVHFCYQIVSIPPLSVGFFFSSFFFFLFFTV